MPRTPQSEIAFNAQTPLYNSGILGNYISYLKSHHADIDIGDLLHCSELTQFDLNDKGYFLSQSQINRFHSCLDERVSDPQLAYRVGQHALNAKSTGTMKQYGLQFFTPASLYKAIDHLYPKWSKGHLSQTAITGKGRAETTISVLPGVKEEPFQCENRKGVLESVSKVLTGLPAQVSHPECMHRGDKACRYEIIWKDKPSAAWKRIGAYTSVVCLAIAAAVPFFAPAGDWVPAVLAMGVACLLVFLFAGRLERGELSAFLKEQGDAAGQLLKENEARYQNSRLVQEIGQAGADILKVDSFLDSVLESMSRNLDFSRGMILLCRDNCQRLQYAAGYGFSQAEKQFLDSVNFDIDMENSSDVFIQTLKSGRPLFVGNLQNQLSKMAPNSLAIQQQLKVETLIVVPLTHNKEPLGLLFVDSQGTGRELTSSDVNLLMGIASQVATGIVNARSYERLQESEERYRLLAENATDVIWILDIDTLAMKYVSPSVEKAQGFTPEEVMAMSIDQYLTPESFERAFAAIGENIDLATAGRIDPKNHSVTLELEEYHKNGSIIPVEVTAGLLLDGSGVPSGVLGISRDMSDRKKAELERTEMQSQLQQAHKMESLGTMAGSIAHNFNNLLMVVQGNLELAVEDLPHTSQAVGSIQRAIKASKRAADLSSMMLTYVGQLKKESLPVDLSQLIRDELGKLDESKAAHVTLDLNLTDPMPLVAADPGQMRQMISGFITNAIEALEDQKGRVRISTGAMFCDASYLSTTYLKEDLPEGMYAYVEVSDTGSGMDPETLGKVFDPFFSTKFTGRGLGMAAVMGIIRSHYGAVKVTSRKGKGSTFTALFPIQGISLKKDASERGPDQTGNEKKTVLLVDDEAMVMEIGSQFLDRLGYQVETASSGQKALDIVNQDPDRIDCLLLDFTMPGMDGLETMKRVKKIRPDAKIIITSGYTRQQIENRFDNITPPDGFIHKPFEMKTLKEKLSRVLAEPD